MCPVRKLHVILKSVPYICTIDGIFEFAKNSWFCLLSYCPFSFSIFFLSWIFDNWLAEHLDWLFVCYIGSAGSINHLWEDIFRYSRVSPLLTQYSIQLRILCLYVESITHYTTPTTTGLTCELTFFCVCGEKMLKFDANFLVCQISCGPILDKGYHR